MFPKNKWKIAIAVAKAESGLNAKIRGDKHLTFTQGGKLYGDSWGCFQVRHLPGRPSPTELKNPEVNVGFAKNLSKNGESWSHWTMYINGKYKEFL